MLGGALIAAILVVPRTERMPPGRLGANRALPGTLDNLTLRFSIWSHA